MRSFEENLRLYAKLIVSQGLGLAPNQELLVVAETDQAPFVRIIAEEAYRAGSKNVEALWRDAELLKVRYREGSDEAMEYGPKWLYDAVARAHRENAARLGIMSTDPNHLAGIAPERIAKTSRTQSVLAKEISDLVSGDAINWCLVGAASPAWAQRVFPDLAVEEATAKLWEKILFTARVMEVDPIGAWTKHSETLASKVRWLNDLRLDALHFTAPGTDLTVGLVEGHRWAGGRTTAKNGITCSANIPTEEVYTMPHRSRVDGFATSTMPLSLRGQIVEGIRVEFRDGAAVSVSATRGEEMLRSLVESDEGARRLGEVALVPHSSKVGQAGTLFLNSLYDENAASHIAFGAAYHNNLSGSDALSQADLLAVGANDSIIHVDWMIGSGEMSVDGIHTNGGRMPLMRSGEWV